MGKCLIKENRFILSAFAHNENVFIVVSQEKGFAVRGSELSPAKMRNDSFQRMYVGAFTVVESFLFASY